MFSLEYNDMIGLYTFFITHNLVVHEDAKLE